MSRTGGSRGSRLSRVPVSEPPDTAGSLAFSSRPGSIRSDATVYTEGDDGDGETLGTELSAVIARATYRPPAHYHSPGMTRFDRYLDDTQVHEIFKRFLKVLLNRSELPYNPYPGFYGRMRAHQEKFHLQNTPKRNILSQLNNPLEDTYLQNLYTIRNYRNVWGLSSLLRVVNPDTLNKYRWLLNDVTPRLDELSATQGYSNQVMVALIGPCVFDGSFYPSVHTVQLRLEYLVTGYDSTEGISIFVNNVMKEVDDMFQSEFHFLLGVNIPSASLTNPENWIKHYWEPEKIQQDKAAFLEKMSDAVIGNRYIYVECIFLLDPSYPSYVRGEKQYGFNFIEVVDELREEGLSTFSEYPMASLHEGVFFDRAHAEAYVSLYQQQMEDLDSEGVYEAGEGAAPRSPGIVSMGDGNHAPNEPSPSRVATARSMNRRFSNAQEHNVNQVKQHVHDRLEHVRPRKVNIDGFRFGDERATGPFAWQITTPIKANHQRKIAGYWRDVELFDIIYSTIILVLMDRDAFEDNILVEAYRLLHGTSGRVHLLMEYNKGLRSVIQAVANTSDFPIIQDLLKEYLDTVVKLFLNPLVERSQDHVVVGQTILAKVEDMILSPDMEFASATHLQFTLRGLKNINLYLIPLLMELSEDSLSHSPEISNLIKMFTDTFPEEDPRPPTRYKNRVADTSFQAGDQDDLEDDVITHGVEDESIRKHETSVINVKTCIGKDMSPQIMVKENVFMKYLLDCRFDEMWNEYLTDLAGGDLFPPNPFPRLISSLRQCAMKMDLFFEKPSVVTERMFNLEIKMEDPENFVHYIPGLDAHGTITSLMMLDTGVFLPLLEIFRSFQQNSYIQKKGPYRVAICLALSGPCIWYGRMQPYLNEIELHEHYYIKGPSGCQGEAMQLCAAIVHSHMVDMIIKSGLPVMGVFFGHPSPDHWTRDDIVNKKKGFLTQFAYTCSIKQPIYAKAYVLIDGWRYVMLKKHFMLHFLEGGSRAEMFYPYNPASFYQSVFLAKDRAAFHYQNCGPPQGGDPMSLANVRAMAQYLEKQMFETQRKCDWLNFYRHLLLHDLILQDQSHITDCWRMLHGMASQFEYVVGMMEVLQDLVLTCLQSGMLDQGKRGSRQSSRGSTSNRNKNPVQHKALTKMVVAFYQKLMYVTESRLTMAARSLSDYIENKLKSALEFDPETGRPYLAIEDKTIFRLEEMKSIMKIFQDTLSSDVRSVCDEIPIKYLPVQKPPTVGTSKGQKKPPSRRTPRTAERNRIQTQPDPYLDQPDVYHNDTRPSSVASNMLDNPDYYKPRNNLMTILE